VRKKDRGGMVKGENQKIFPLKKKQKTSSRELADGVRPAREILRAFDQRKDGGKKGGKNKTNRKRNKTQIAKNGGGL